MKSAPVAKRCLIASFSAGMAVVGTFLVASVGLSMPPWWAVLVVVGAFFAAEAAEIRFVVGAEVWSLSLTELALGVTFIVVPGGWLALACALAVTILMVVRRASVLKAIYNASMFWLSAAVAVSVSQIFGGAVLGATYGIAAFILCNFAFVTFAVHVATGRPLRALAGTSGLLTILQSAGSASVGVLAGWLATHAPLGLLGLIVPLAIIWQSYRAQVRQVAESRMFEELATGHELVTGKSADTSARVVAAAANRLLGGVAEIIIVTDEAPILYRAAAEGEPVSCERQHTALSEQWVVEALGLTHLEAGVADRRPYLLARLGRDDSPSAVLRVVRPELAPAFERHDEMMAQILVRQANAWFEVVGAAAERDEAVARAEMADAASRVIGDMGAETLPALARLRESAVRLTRLANSATSREGVGDIVEELHSAERAVASLLGAIAMAADTQLAADEIVQLPTGTRSSDDDWTTTGILDLEAVDGKS